MLNKIPSQLLPEAAEKFIDDLVAGTAQMKFQVDSENAEVKKLREDLEKADKLKKARQLNEAKGLKRNSQTNIKTANDNSSAVVNNVTYNVNAPNNLAAGAIRNALGI